MSSPLQIGVQAHIGGFKHKRIEDAGNLNMFSGLRLDNRFIQPMINNNGSSHYANTTGVLDYSSGLNYSSDVAQFNCYSGYGPQTPSGIWPSFTTGGASGTCSTNLMPATGIENVNLNTTTTSSDDENFYIIREPSDTGNNTSSTPQTKGEIYYGQNNYSFVNNATFPVIISPGCDIPLAGCTCTEPGFYESQDPVYDLGSPLSVNDYKYVDHFKSLSFAWRTANYNFFPPIQTTYLWGNVPQYYMNPSFFFNKSVCITPSYTTTAATAICTFPGTDGSITFTNLGQLNFGPTPVFTQGAVSAGGDWTLATYTSNGESAPFGPILNGKIENLTAGTYTILITPDIYGNNCPVTITFSISEIINGTGIPSISNLVALAPPCHGGYGSVSFTYTLFDSATYTIYNATTGAATNLTGQWINSTGNWTIPNNPLFLPGEQFWVYILQDDGCEYNSTAFTIPTAPPLLNGTGQTTDVSCFGGSDGCVTVGPLSNSGADPYTVTITDASSTVLITQSQNGGTFGVVNSGVNSYTELCGLSPGSYTIDAADANGCPINGWPTTTDVLEPDVLSIVATATPPTCQGGLGTISWVTTGGVSPYQYDVTDPSGVVSVNVASPLSINLSGMVETFTVDVTDANGCTSTDQATFATFLVNTITVSTTNINCNSGTDGVMTVQLLAAGSNNPLTHSANAWWVSNVYDSTGATVGTNFYTTTTPDTYTIELLNWGPDGMPPNVGTWIDPWTVEITDSNGCIYTYTNITFDEPDPLTYTYTKSDESCGGPSTNDGSISLNISGGTAPYGIEWFKDGVSYPAGSGLTTITGLDGGVYTAEVNDAGWNSTVIETFEANTTLGSTLIDLDPNVYFFQASGSPFFNNSGIVAILNVMDVYIEGPGFPTGTILSSTGYTPSSGTYIDTFTAPVVSTSTNIGAAYKLYKALDSDGCYLDITAITILEDAIEDLQISVTIPPNCVGGDDGKIWIKNTTGDFNFNIWFSTDGITFLQIESPILYNVPSTTEFNFIDLGTAFQIDNGFTYVVGGANLSLVAGDYHIYLKSVVNACQSPTVTATIAPSNYIPMTWNGMATYPTCCDLFGKIVVDVNDGYAPMGYKVTVDGWDINGNAVSSGPVTMQLPYSPYPTGLAYPGVWTITVEDDCGQVITETITITRDVVEILDIDFINPPCADAPGSITIQSNQDLTDANSGGKTYHAFSVDNGMTWVSADPGFITNALTYNITDYNNCSTCPGTFSVLTTNATDVIIEFTNLPQGTYRIWARDNNACTDWLVDATVTMANAVGTPVFNDFFYDCAPTGIVPGYTQLINGSNVCVDICASCSDVACYANYVDSYVSPLGVWNGGTKVLLDPVSNLQVNVLSGNGTTLMGGSDGEITFSITDTTYVGMTWNIYIDSIIPSTSGLTYDSNLQSGTYGSVNCSTQVCCPMGVLSQVNTNTCPGNSTGWAFELSESGVEICPTLDGNSDSTGQYAYQPAFTGGSVTKTFTLTNLSVVNSPATTGSDNEVMYIIRLVTDLGCVDCDAHVIDNGLRNLFDIYLAEDCECHCEPGFTLQTDGTCDGEYISAAETNCKCFESDGTVSSFTNQTDCQTAGLFWNCEWTATTIQQNAPSVWNTLTWGAVGAQLFGQFTDLVTANFGTVDISSASLPLSRIENAGAFNTIPATAAVLVDNNSTLYSFADSMAFSNTNSLFTSRLLTIGIWPAAINLYTSVSDPFVPSNEWVGITTCITLNQTTDFILGCAAKDKFRLTINGELIIDFGFFGWTNTGPLQTMNSSTWNLIPIGLPSGDYTLTFEGSNDGTMGGAAFAFELYPVDLGSTPTQNLLADAGLTDSTNTIGYAGGSVGLADIVVLDNNNNPISSAHYINSPIHTGSMVGYHCNPSTEYFSNCGGSNVCISALEGEECELPINCPEYLDDIVGCIGDLGDVVYNRLLGGLMKGGEGYREDLANIWRVILIKFLFRHSYSCLSQENLLSFAKFLNKLCPDCESKIKTYQDVNYLEDPNSSNTGIAGLNQTPDINTFDF